jgi:TPR repeat protein
MNQTGAGVNASVPLIRAPRSGRGVAKKDEVTAARWYKKAADQGMVDAKKSLARWERTG